MTFKRLTSIALTCSGLAISACSDDASSEAVSQVVEASGPQPNYDQQDGDLYMYVGQAPEEAAARGEANPVAIYRYLGEQGGEYRLEMVADDGSRIAELACSAPCRVAKQTDAFGNVERFAVGPRSLNAAAFRDAANGLLEVSLGPVTPGSESQSFDNGLGKDGEESVWEQKSGKCRLAVAGDQIISGDCTISYLDTRGSFIISSPDDQYFAYLVKGERSASGFWNKTPGADYAQTELGQMEQSGECWKNAGAEICAWEAK